MPETVCLTVFVLSVIGPVTQPRRGASFRLKCLSERVVKSLTALAQSHFPVDSKPGDADAEERGTLPQMVRIVAELN